MTRFEREKRKRFSVKEEDTIVDWGASNRGFCLIVSGFIVATQGDVVRDPELINDGRLWTKEMILKVVNKYREMKRK